MAKAADGRQVPVWSTVGSTLIGPQNIGDNTANKKNSSTDVPEVVAGTRDRGDRNKTKGREGWDRGEGDRGGMGERRWDGREGMGWERGEGLYTKCLRDAF